MSDNDDDAPPPPPRASTPPQHEQQQQQQQDDGDDDDIYQKTLQLALQMQQQQHQNDDDDGERAAQSKPNSAAVGGSSFGADQQHQPHEQEQEEVAVDPQAHIEVGDVVCGGKYRIKARCGEGTSSVVYLATHEGNSSSGLLALKIFKADPHILESFDYERKINEYVARMQREYDRDRSSLAAAAAAAAPHQQPAALQAARKSPSQRSSFSKLPFAAQDAWFRVQHQHLPKAQVRASRDPSFFMVRSPHSSATSPESAAATAAAATGGSAQRGRSATSSTSSMQVTPRRRVSPRRHMAAAAAAASATQNSNGSQPRRDDDVASPDPRRVQPSQQPQPQPQPQPQAQMRSGGVAALRSHCVHYDTRGAGKSEQRPTRHPVLVFDALGPSVEWLMSVFGYKGVPLPVALQIVESAAEALAALEPAHIVTCDLKPENLLLLERDHARLESVAKKSLATHGGVFSLFRVSLIDLGLSFLLPVAQRPAAARGKNQPAVASTVRSAASSSRGRSRSESQAQAQAPPSPSRKQAAAGVAPSAEELVLLRMSNYRRGVRIQTREYRAPEVLLGAHFDGRADVFSLGCTAFELVTGQFLFDPKCDVDVSAVLSPDQAQPGNDAFERLLDLRHLWEMRRVMGEPPASYLEKFGDGGSGIFASRFVDAPSQRGQRRTFRFLCECPKKHDEQEGSSGAEAVSEYDAAALRAPEQEGGRAARFCPTCLRFSVPPPAERRDLLAESAARFGMDAEGHRYFVSFVHGCIAWGSDRMTASELLRHPWLVLWGRQFA